MGMTIDTSLLYESGYNKGFKDGIKGSILKADYETRLKADMVAMLTEIQLEIEEQRQDNPEFNIWKDGYNTANDIDCVIIQQKINTLKEQNNESN